MHHEHDVIDVRWLGLWRGGAGGPRGVEYVSIYTVVDAFWFLRSGPVDTHVSPHGRASDPKDPRLCSSLAQDIARDVPVVHLTTAALAGVAATAVLLIARCVLLAVTSVAGVHPNVTDPATREAPLPFYAGFPIALPDHLALPVVESHPSPQALRVETIGNRRGANQIGDKREEWDEASQIRWREQDTGIDTHTTLTAYTTRTQAHTPGCTTPSIGPTIVKSRCVDTE